MKSKKIRGRKQKAIRTLDAALINLGDVEDHLCKVLEGVHRGRARDNRTLSHFAKTLEAIMDLHGNVVAATWLTHPFLRK